MGRSRRARRASGDRERVCPVRPSAPAPSPDGAGCRKFGMARALGLLAARGRRRALKAAAKSSRAFGGKSAGTRNYRPLRSVRSTGSWETGAGGDATIRTARKGARRGDFGVGVAPRRRCQSKRRGRLILSRRLTPRRSARSTSVRPNPARRTAALRLSPRPGVSTASCVARIRAPRHASRFASA